MTTKETVVVIHGSALTSASPRDVDVIYIGDRGAASSVARAWAINRFGERGETLPLDMHESASSDRIVVPAVPGRETPYEVIAGEALPETCTPEERAVFTSMWRRPAPYVVVEVRTYRGIASYLRSPLSAAEMHAGITFAVNDRPLTARFSISEAVTGEWGEYCDGPTAIRSGIAKCHCWKELLEIDPEFYRLIETVAEVGDRNLSAEVREHFARSSGAIRQTGACVIDVWWQKNGPRPGPVVHATHSAVEWSLSGFTALLRGEHAEPLPLMDFMMRPYGLADYAEVGFPQA